MWKKRSKSLVPKGTAVVRRPDRPVIEKVAVTDINRSPRPERSKPFAFQSNLRAKREEADTRYKRAVAENIRADGDLVQAETELTLIEDEASDIEVILKANRQERENRLKEAQHREAELDRDLYLRDAITAKDVAELEANTAEAKVRSIEAAEKFERTERRLDRNENDIDGYRDKKEQAFEKRQIDDDIEAKENARQADSRYQKKQALELVKAQRLNELIERSTRTQMSPEDFQREAQNIKDHYDQEINKI